MRRVANLTTHFGEQFVTLGHHPIEALIFESDARRLKALRVIGCKGVLEMLIPAERFQVVHTTTFAVM